MKTVRNLFLVFALTVTFAYADGHTGSGNRCDTCPPPCTENCGGFAAAEPEVMASEELKDPETEETSVLDYWSKVIFELIG